jgi:regulator of protease activity HflC (stomatin/prohibitin superfamily)
MLDELTWDFLIRTGIPAGLGVVVVMYLLRSIIPEMQKTFREEMAASRKTFEDTIKAEQETHKALMAQVTQTIQSEGQQTRTTLQNLDNTTKQLSQTVYKLYGHSMTAFEVVNGGSGSPDDKKKTG